MNLIEDLKARGLVEHHSAPVEKIFESKRTIYLGVDPSADSMHAGHLMVVLTMRRLAEAGHRIILLVGGGTGMIGDPRESGERKLADASEIKRNAKALKEQMQRLVGTKVTLVNNADWLLKIKLVDFLRDIGKHFTVNELVKRDIIRRRLETPDESISYTEFAYSLLQGYDYMVLNQKYGADVQIGASDQWTNILSGVELIRRKLNKEAFAFTTPLVTDANGKKFGKSEGNAVWLDPKKTSPFDFYQFWLNQSDATVGQYLKYFTFLPTAEIDAIIELHGRNPERRTAQKKLAEEVTKLVHGQAALDAAMRQTESVFGQNRDIAVLKEHVQTLEIRISDNVKVIDAVVNIQLANSKGEARRLIEGGGISIDGAKVTDVNASTASLTPGDHELRRGTRSSVLSVGE